MRRRAVVRGAKGAGRNGALALGLLALVAGCTDPRARPVPPAVHISMASQLVVASPGPLLGSLYLFDSNGIDSIRVRLELGNGSVVGDSTFFLSGSDPFEATLPVQWQLPGGIPDHTIVRLVARARSYIGFVAADTFVTAVGDTLHGSS